MKICVLGSGSKGNATYIEAGDTAVLIDNGFSGKELQKRLTAIGVPMDRLSAILVSHEHTDHIRGVGVLSRRLELPIYANRATLQAAEAALGRLHCSEPFTAGTAFTFQNLTIHPFAVSHDAADPVGFTITDGNITVGYCTDTGRVTKLMRHRLAACHCLILESNHDPELLRNGPYPVYLQQRIRSSNGHLDNETAAAFLSDLAHNGLRHVCLAHLSETNNSPKIALQTATEALANSANRPTIFLAPQDRPTECIVLKE
jgi:phosphoribosyl 1,2-cyclic phosphodiesterase